MAAAGGFLLLYCSVRFGRCGTVLSVLIGIRLEPVSSDLVWVCEEMYVLNLFSLFFNR